jgi:hypothetical protein
MLFVFQMLRHTFLFRSHAKIQGFSEKQEGKTKFRAVNLQKKILNMPSLENHTSHVAELILLQDSVC